MKTQNGLARDCGQVSSTSQQRSAWRKPDIQSSAGASIVPEGFNQLPRAKSCMRYLSGRRQMRERSHRTAVLRTEPRRKGVGVGAMARYSKARLQTARVQCCTTHARAALRMDSRRSEGGSLGHLAVPWSISIAEQRPAAE